MKFARLLFVGILPLLLTAQNPKDLLEKAPPAIDQALRARVKFFYQAHVDGKFRLADTVVHEDSKDAFFVAEKDRYRGFDILKINYSDNFTKATVVVAVDSDFFLPGFGKTPVTIPLTSTWKYDKGQWWWYVKPPGKEGVKTPFGAMKPGPAREKAAVYDRLQHMPTREEIAAKVKVSKTRVQLSSVEPGKDEVEVFNGMPGPISLRLQFNGFAGFEAKLEKRDLTGGEKTKIILRCNPKNRRPKQTLTVKLIVEPINYVIPIRVEFSLPPELKKYLPKQQH